MSQRLFSVPKVPVFLDTFAPGSEKRRGETVKIVRATLRVQPFDAKWANAIDDGLGDDSGVRAALFKLSNPEPKPHISQTRFVLGCPRQQLIIFASSDTATSRIALDQVKIFDTYARLQKDVDGYAFIFKASFGPVSDTELELLLDWYSSQRSVTFDAAEPLMDFFDDDNGEDEGDEPAGLAPGRPTPMFDDADPAAAAPPAGEAVRPIAKRGSAKGPKKTDHDAERQAQRAEGKKRAKKKAPHTPARKRR